MAISMGGVAKIFAGELVEAARELRQESGEKNGPLKPSDIRRAYRKLKASSGKLASC